MAGTTEAKTVAAKAESTPLDPNKWECPGCGEINKVEREKCNTCGKAKPEPKPEAAKSPDDAKADAEAKPEPEKKADAESKPDAEAKPEAAAKTEWECTSCGEINKMEREKCNS